MPTATRAAVLAAAFILALGASVSADPRTCPGSTPVPNGAVILLRVFNDCPSSVVTATNSYPDTITIQDAENDCFGFANLHGWNFSADGGATTALFENCSQFEYSSDVMLSGSGNGEGGLRISPWWNAPSYGVDGRFMLNAATGEIACFGGRLPFYSFTGIYGLRYVKGTTAHMAIAYAPNGLSSASPATITYTLGYHDSTFTSGPLPFDEGNVDEAAAHGSWGLLDASGVGGYVQALVGAGTMVDFAATWTDIEFQGQAPPPDLDADDDGVPDTEDQCPGTPAGALVDAHGCAIEQYVPCGGPMAGGTWRNHGQYVSSVAHTAEMFLAQGLITEMQKDSIMSAAGRSSCGKGMKPTIVRGAMSRLAAGPARSVQFELPAPAWVRFGVVDVTGRRVLDLAEGYREAGSHTVAWDASRLRSGVYFYRLQAGEDVVTDRFIVVR